VIGKVLKPPAVLPENAYNMTGITISKLNAVKVLVSKDKLEGYGDGAFEANNSDCN